MLKKSGWEIDQSHLSSFIIYLKKLLIEVIELERKGLNINDIIKKP